MNDNDCKILVLGDSGVGKSSLVHLICHGTVLSSAQWTIGCSIDVRLHNNYFLQFWDIGGSRAHKIARSFLYQEYHGIILVFDATNKKSRLNLNKWLREENLDNSYVPTLTIGTKKDLLPYGSVTDSTVLYVNTQDYLSSSDYDRLNSFYKQVIDKRSKKFYNKYAI